MEKIKVLRIITRMNIGGPAIQATLLSEGLDEDRFSSVLITGQVGKGEGDMSYLAKEKGIEPLVISELHREINIVDDIISFYKLFKFLKKEKPSIVHTHTAKAGAIGRVAARLAGVPLVIHTFHGHTFHSYFSPIKTKFFVFIERLLAAITDKIIVISEKQENEIKQCLKLNGSNKLVLIPLGFDLEAFLNIEKRDEGAGLRGELGIPKEAIVVAILGRLTAIKNHRMFLEAAKEIKRKNSGKVIKFLIVGDGELKDELTDLSDRLGIRLDVIFAGWRKDTDSLYKTVDIVTLTSLNEGTPVSVIEASASARPVVATNVGGVRDVIEDGKSGFLVPLGDISTFSESVSTLIRDRAKREEFGLRGREFIKKKHSKEKLIGAIENLYTRELRKKV